MKSFINKLLFIITILLYNIANTILLPLFIIIYAVNPYTNKNFLNRFGLKIKRGKNKNGIMVHGSSAGEASIAYSFFPQAEYFTVFNQDGYNILKRKNINNINMLPIDNFILTYLFLKYNKIKKLVLIEQDIWPSLIVSAKILGVKLYLVNGIIYNKSYESMKLFSFLYGNLFNYFAKIFVQSERDFNRLISMGVNKNLIEITGTVKLRVPIEIADIDEKEEIMNNFSKKNITFASFHKNEFDLIKDIILKYKEKYNYIIVPRYLHETPLLCNIFPQAMLLSTLLKQNNNNLDPSELLISSIDKNGIIIIDKMGYLFEIYKYSSISLVGGSFYNFGSQNFIEPIANYCPVIIGKYYYNFQESFEILSENGVCSVNKNEVVDFIEKIDNNYNSYQKEVEDGRSVIDKYIERFEDINRQINCE